MDKNIVPWKCHLCSKTFEGIGGGICSHCKHPACLLHLRFSKKKPPQKNEKHGLVCTDCLRWNKEGGLEDD